MSDTATYTTGDDSYLGDERDRLLQAIAALNEEQQLAALGTARERAQRERWAASSKVNEAERVLQQANRDEPTRAAYAFANSEVNSVSPVVAAQAAVDAATAEHHRLEQIESVLEGELEQLQSRLQRHHVAVNAALASVVCGSEQFRHLCVELDNAWARIRGIRKAFYEIDKALHGQMPHQFQMKWQSMPSLDPLALRIATDERFSEVWREAIARLSEDPDYDLPKVY